MSARANASEPARPGEDESRDTTVLTRLMALKRMSVAGLKAEWRALFGADAPNNSRSFLELRLAYRIQELAYGGPSRETVRLLDALADELRGNPDRKTRIVDPRRPVAGTRLVRQWNGVEHTVTVLRDGFEFEGRKYKSLSAIARAIAGTRWNGWRFFGLRAAGGVR
ncbi:MAG TPA: DUF2924 domain-containing protein [Bauldia sp.]|nr:DUF2924 domain-containing protein [Bauldia sp.]